MTRQIPIVQAQQLRKSFGSLEVVKGIDFQVMPGQCFGILGPNGAGKTTTLRMLLGLSPISSGSLKLFGLPMSHAGRQIRARIGVVPQMDTLDPDFSVEQNLTVFANYFGLSPQQKRERIPQLLKFAELEEKAKVRIDKLSGGMKRRLTIARALLNDPELVLLDEPTTGLDPQVRHLIWARLRTLLSQGKTLLLTTHYMEEAERLCDEIIIMEQGSIVAQGSPKALIQSHATAEVFEIRGEALEEVQQALRQCSDCRVEVLGGDLLYCYSTQAKEILQVLENYQQLNFMHRRGNLEDVFLKLTGRDLRE